MTHDLKILPQFFEAVVNGDKTFEVRKDDRPYKVGDKLVLKETGGHGFTGREIEATVTYILRDVNYCKPGFCILSIRT